MTLVLGNVVARESTGKKWSREGWSVRRGTFEWQCAIFKGKSWSIGQGHRGYIHETGTQWRISGTKNWKWRERTNKFSVHEWANGWMILAYGFRTLLCSCCWLTVALSCMRKWQVSDLLVLSESLGTCNVKRETETWNLDVTADFNIIVHLFVYRQDRIIIIILWLC